MYMYMFIRRKIKKKNHIKMILGLYYEIHILHLQISVQGTCSKTH